MVHQTWGGEILPKNQNAVLKPKQYMKKQTIKTKMNPFETYQRMTSLKITLHFSYLQGRCNYCFALAYFTLGSIQKYFTSFGTSSHGEEDIPIGKNDSLDDKSFDDSVNPTPGSSGTQKKEVPKDSQKNIEEKNLRIAL